LEEKMILVEYLEKMMKERKIGLSSSSVGSLILWVPKPNAKRLRLSIDNRHLNDYKIKETTHLPIMDRLSPTFWECDLIFKVDLETRFHFIRIALGHKKFTVFRIQFGLHEYLVGLDALTNVPPTFPREIS
jgi:hypothetical protein